MQTIWCKIEGAKKKVNIVGFYCLLQDPCKRKHTIHVLFFIAGSRENLHGLYDTVAANHSASGEIWRKMGAITKVENATICNNQITLTSWWPMMNKASLSQPGKYKYKIKTKRHSASEISTRTHNLTFFSQKKSCSTSNSISMLKYTHKHFETSFHWHVQFTHIHQFA